MQQRVRDAYAARAAEYIEVCGTIDAADVADRSLIAGWADGVGGPILDVGCGPGQWTNFLRGRGCEVTGIDPVPEFVAEARAAYPGVEYRVGHAGALDWPTASVQGVLAWFSLIHTCPGDIDVALADLARVLEPGGRLLIGFFTGPELSSFDHKVTPAWFWPVDALSERLDQAGFATTDRHVRRDDLTGREVGAIEAQVQNGGSPRLS